MFRRQPGHVSGEKSSCSEAFLTHLVHQSCPWGRFVTLQLRGARLSLHAQVCALI